MAVMNIIQAVNNALKIEMKRDPRVVIMGEDVGKFGGVFRATTGLAEEFGAHRVVDTPLSEGGIIGAAMGMAVYGMRPVPEIQFMDFIFPAYDHIVNEIAKCRYRSGAQFTCPIVIRTPYGGGIRGGHYHSQSPESLFIHVPGLKVVVPATPYEAKGLLLSSIRDNDPVIFMEPKRVYRAAKGEVPEEDYTIPLGKAEVTKPGEHITVIAWGSMLHTVLKAEAEAQKQGWNLEVINLRTLSPWDQETVIASVQKTGRALIVHEAPKTNGFGGEIAATIVEKAFYSLQAPVMRVTGWDTPFPYTLENDYLPSVPRIIDACKQLMQS